MVNDRWKINLFNTQYQYQETILYKNNNIKKQLMHLCFIYLLLQSWQQTKKIITFII